MKINNCPQSISSGKVRSNGQAWVRRGRCHPKWFEKAIQSPVDSGMSYLLESGEKRTSCRNLASHEPRHIVMEPITRIMRPYAEPPFFATNEVRVVVANTKIVDLLDAATVGDPLDRN